MDVDVEMGYVENMWCLNCWSDSTPGSAFATAVISGDGPSLSRT